MPMPARASRSSTASRTSAPSSGPMAMPRNVAALTRPMRSRARVPGVEVAGAGRGQRHDGARAGALDGARHDHLLERLGSARRATSRCAKMARAPIMRVGRSEAVRGPACQRRGRDVGDEVGRDDPRGAAQVLPAGEVDDDAGQGHRGDEELDAHEQHAQAERGQHDGARSGAHAGWGVVMSR